MGTISEPSKSATESQPLTAGAISAAANAAEYGVWTADARGRLTYVAPCFLELLGRAEDEVLGDRWVGLLANEVQNLNVLSWRQAIEAGQPFERFHAYITATGERRTVWVRANPITGSDGRIEGWAGLHLRAPFATSQTAPHGTEVERLLESTTEGFVALDGGLRFTYVNRVAIEMIQSTPETVLGRSYWEVFPQFKGTIVEREYQRVLDRQEAVHFEFHLESIELWLEIHAYPTDGGISVYFRDISRRRKAESRLTAALRGARAGVWEWEVTSDHMNWSPEMFELMGVDPALPPSRELFFGLLVPDDQAKLYVAAVEAFDRTSEMSVELRLVTGNRWVGLTAKVVRDADGKALRMVGLGQDVTERRRAEESLRAAQDSLALAMQAGRMGYWTRQLNPDVVTWSPELEELFGLEKGTFSGDESQFLKFVVKEDRHLVVTAVQNAIRTGQDYSVEFRFRRVDGSVRWMEGRGRATYDANGKATWLHGIGIDITERKESEARYRRLAENVPCIVWTTDPHGITHFVNLRWTEVTGRESPILTREDWAYVIHPEDQARVREQWTSAKGGYDTYDAEVRYRTVGGAYRWFLERAEPVVGDDGRIVEWFGTSVDIHAQKTKEQFLDFLVRLGEAHRSLESPGEIVETTVRMLGEHLGASRVAYERISSDGMSFEVEFDYASGMESKTGRFPIESLGWNFVEASKLGGTYVVSEGAAHIRVPVVRSGRLLAALVVEQSSPRGWTDDDVRLVEMVADRLWANYVRAKSDQDLRELNAELEQRVEERTAALMEANREMEGFTYTVSHDLRAPLRAITATSMILLEEAGPKLASEERSLLERQAHNAKHLGVLIDELLRLSRLSRQEMAMNPFDMSKLGASIVDEIQSDGRAGSVRFEVQSEMRAIGDIKLISFVLLNLFENAAKFSPNGGVVRFGNNEHGFFVSDDGIGFDPAYKEKLFRPFERLVSQAEFPGTGIGLANVKRIVERHGGTVWAESSPGEGATFWFTLDPSE